MELFRIRATNLGRIKDELIPIHPLTVFFGPNNTNKTWLATAIYGLARRLQIAVPNWVVEDEYCKGVVLDDETASQISYEADRVIAMVERAPENTSTVVRILGSEVKLRQRGPLRLILNSKALSDLLFVDEANFANSSVSLTMEEAAHGTVWFARRPEASELTLKIGNSSPKLFSAHLGDDYIKNATITGLGLATLKQDFVLPAIADLVLARFKKVIAFPAERKALIELCHDANFRGEGLFSRTGVHFLQLLRLLAFVQFAPQEKGSVPIAEVLEDELLGGRVEAEKGLAGSRWVYQSKEGLRLELPAASSLVRSLGGFNAYLRLFARPGDLIVIDEPEMNAHPDAQLAITEVLCRLVNAGVNVILTTHSPYIVDHINNLMEAAELSQEKQSDIASRFKLGGKDAFISTENVACYEFSEDGKIRDRLGRSDRIIDWSTFGDVSDRISNLYTDILDASRLEHHDAV